MDLTNPENWVAIAFVLFVAGTAKPIWRALTGALDGRAERIRAELDEAKRLREEAHHTLAEYQRKQRQAVKEAEEIVNQAREDAKRLSEAAAEEIEAALARRERQAMERIAQAETEAVAEVRALAVDLAMTATRQILASRIDEKKAAALVEDAIAEVDAKLH